MDIIQRLKDMWTGSDTGATSYVSYAMQFIMLTVLFFLVFRVLKYNKATVYIAVFVFFEVFCGFGLMLVDGISSGILLVIILLMAILIFTMFHTEIKRTLLDANVKKSKGKSESVNTKGIELIIDETVRAIQSMSKKDIGALIVLSDENLPEGIIESGTVVDARISSQLIETIFYPKSPLHDGAMIIEGSKVNAAGCFLPLAQSEKLPKELGSRHRAALGVTSVASVTAIVVSEETGIISIVKNGVIKKKYADASDLKNALSDYYWSELTAEGKR